MAYELLCENCQGCRTKFIEQNGDLLHKRVGKLYSGTLALQTFDDTDYIRITFADGKNVWGGAFKKIFGIYNGLSRENPIKAYSAAHADYLCNFDFSEKELRNRKKKVEYWLSCSIPPRYCLEFYDFSDHTGCCYFFPNEDEAKKWARRLGIKKVKWYDMNGDDLGEKPL